MAFASAAKVNIDYAQVYIVACKVSQRITVLVERQPEEDYHDEQSHEPMQKNRTFHHLLPDEPNLVIN